MFIVHSSLVLTSCLNYSLVVLGCGFPLLTLVPTGPGPSILVASSEEMIVGLWGF